MVEYDVRTLQLRILGNLLAVDRVCREHALHYYIYDGTMLGAVRHKGFIPWDDDLDIAMPREDYETFITYANEWLEEPYEFVSYETDSTYPLPFGKVQDASTTLVERAHLPYLGGLYIDVFPIDGVPSNVLLRRLHLVRYDVLKKLVYMARCCVARSLASSACKEPHVACCANIHSVRATKCVCSTTASRASSTSRCLVSPLP